VNGLPEANLECLHKALHDLGNALMVISANADLIADGVYDGSVAQLRARSIRHAVRTATLAMAHIDSLYRKQPMAISSMHSRTGT